MTRGDALTTYAMDRFLYRLGRSSHAREFFLKGGVLAANLVRAPHRFTRDIDLLRSHGPPDLDDMRERFRDIASVVAEDGLSFDPAGGRATLATRELDGYDGVRVIVRGMLAGTIVELSIDIGFGDALEPAAERRRLASFLAEDPAAEVYAYEVGPVLAEKVETLFARFPLIEHRLKTSSTWWCLPSRKPSTALPCSHRSARPLSAEARPSRNASWTNSSRSCAEGAGRSAGRSCGVRRPSP
jgi:hypothetical protein